MCCLTLARVTLAHCVRNTVGHTTHYRAHWLSGTLALAPAHRKYDLRQIAMIWLCDFLICEFCCENASRTYECFSRPLPGCTPRRVTHGRCHVQRPVGPKARVSLTTTEEVCESF